MKLILALSLALLLEPGQAQTTMPSAHDPDVPPAAAWLKGLPPDVQEKLAELRGQSDALPRPKVLDAATLHGIADKDLVFAISWYVGERMRTSGLSREEVLRQEPVATRDFYLTTLLEAEVLNGGFNQYFWNVPHDLVLQTAAALGHIGAKSASEVFEVALLRGSEEAGMRRKFKAVGTIQAFSESYRHSQLQPLDDRFAAVTEDLAARRIAFLRANETAFLKTPR